VFVVAVVVMGTGFFFSSDGPRLFSVSCKKLQYSTQGKRLLPLSNTTWRRKHVVHLKACLYCIFVLLSCCVRRGYYFVIYLYKDERATFQIILKMGTQPVSHPVASQTQARHSDSFASCSSCKQ
jgi:hypothetical protein